MILRNLRAYLAHRKIMRAARKRLQIITDERRISDEIVSYRVRRKAALKHQPREWAQ